MTHTEFLQQLEPVVLGDPQTFKEFLKQNILNRNSEFRYTALIGILERLPETSPEKCADLSDILHQAVQRTKNPSWIGLSWYVRIVALLCFPETDLLLKALRDSLAYCAATERSHSAG